MNISKLFIETTGLGMMHYYIFEASLVLLGAFILGYLFRYFINTRYKRKIKNLKEENQLLRMDMESLQQLGKNENEIEKLKLEISRLNSRLSDLIASKMSLENDLEQARKSNTSSEEIQAKPETSPVKTRLDQFSAMEIKPDDLTRIEGIGPKIAQMLKNAGIDNFYKLSKSDTDQLKEIVIKGGPNFAVHDPSTWAEQADLAFHKKWDKLELMQKALKGGKRKS